MLNRRKLGHDFWDRWEHNCQTVVTVLGHPMPTASLAYQDALTEMSQGLMLLAVHFLTRLRVAGPRELAEDAVQRWHQRMLFRGFAQYRRSGNGRPFAPYGGRTLWNICVTIHRERRRSRDANPLVDVAEQRDTYPLSAERAEICEIVLKAMAELTPNVRAAMTLTELQGLSSREAAAELDTTERIVNSRNFRGREQLRKRLSAGGLVVLDYQT